MQFLIKQLNFRRIQSINSILNSSIASVSTKSHMAAPGSNKHKIGICQLTCTNDKVQNFNTCKQLVEEAHQQGAKVSEPIISEMAVKRKNSPRQTRDSATIKLRKSMCNRHIGRPGPQPHRFSTASFSK